VTVTAYIRAGLPARLQTMPKVPHRCGRNQADNKDLVEKVGNLTPRPNPPGCGTNIVLLSWCTSGRDFAPNLPWNSALAHNIRLMLLLDAAKKVDSLSSHHHTTWAPVACTGSTLSFTVREL
jgi:hypothetical protein